MAGTPAALRGHQFTKGNRSGTKPGSTRGKSKSGSGGPPWDPDNDNDVDVPSKLPPGKKNTGDTDHDAGKGGQPSTVKAVRDMVAAEKKVSPAKKAAHRRKVIAGARKIGAMAHVPSHWKG